jgi:N-acetylneuraminate lyase
MKPHHITGLISAPFTAFKADGSLNLNLIEKQAASLVANRVAGAFVCGSTGEGQSLTLAERMQVAERWTAVADKKLRVIVHTGHTCLADAKTLAAHAQKSKAAAVGCMAPYYFKPPGIRELAQFCAAVAASAPALPFYYYHIPSMTGVSFPMAEFLPVARELIPNLAGVKFTFENLMDFAQCVRMDDGRFDMLFGRDEILLAGLSLGARGAIGSTYNYSAPVYHRVIAAFAKGDLATAQKEQAHAAELIAIMIRYGGLPAAKVMMGFIGLDCGPVRLPLRNLTADQQTALRRDLEQAGFF